MNAFGRNRTLYLKKIGCRFVDIEEGGRTYTEIVTGLGEYVGLADLGGCSANWVANLIFRKRLTKPCSIDTATGLSIPDGEHPPVSLAFSEREQRWYGFNRFGYNSYGIGDRCYDSPTDTIATLEEARKNAISYAILDS